MSEKRKKVAIFFPFDADPDKVGIGGAERRLSAIVSHFDQQKYDTTVIFLTHIPKPRMMDILSTCFGYGKLVTCPNFREVSKLLLKEKFDVLLYTDCQVRNKPPVILAKLIGTKRILIIESTTNANEVFSKSFKHRFRKAMFKMNLALANRVDCLYPSATEKLTRKYPQRRFTATPCCLPQLDEYLSADVEKEKIVFFAGRFSSGKNADLFVDAIALSKERLLENGYRVLLCGSGPLEEGLREQIERVGCKDLIEMPGYVDMRAITPKASIFCSLQFIENYPSQSLLEAIASGCYCIITNFGDSHILAREPFGTLVEANAESISDAINKGIDLINTDQEIIRSAAIQFARDNFSMDKTIHYFEELVDEVTK